MVLVGKLPVITPWLLAALVLYVAVVLLGLLGDTPTLKKQIPAHGKRAAGFERVQGAGLALAIVVLMVLKPALRG